MSRARISEYSVGGSVFLFGGIVLLLLFAKVVLIPLAFALALAFLLLPAVTRLEKRGMRRTLAVSLVSVVTCLFLVGATYVLSRQVLHIAQTLPSYRPNIEQKTKALHSPWQDSLKQAYGMLEDLSRDLTHEASPTGVMQVRVVGQRSEQLRTTATLVGSILDPIGQVGIVLIFTLYMLMNREELRHRLLLLAGMEKLSPMTKALGDATARISEYLVLQFEVNACYGILFGGGLSLLHVPGAILWGVIAAVLRIVPFVGTLTATVIPLVLAIAVSSGWRDPLLVVGLFFVLEMTAANIIEPWLFSERTGISSLALLVSAIFWSTLWGWSGLILSTPLTVCVVVMGRYVPEFSFLHSMLGTDVKLTPAAHVYERLLAMDQAEAWAIAERFLDGKPLAQLYDQVVLPVLTLAEEDKHKGALTDVQSRFVFLSMGELVARLTDYLPKTATDAERSVRSLAMEARRAHLQKQFAVICISAGDQGDELATVMLTQLLEQAGHLTVMLGADAMSDEILRALAGEKDTVIFISALPPFAFAQTRALCHRVRTHLPENRIAVALWNSGDDAEEMVARFGAARPEAVVGTLEQAIVQVKVWQRNTRKA